MTGSARSLDHVVIFARDLQSAAATYRRLGFQVLPLMEHAEIGTSNTVMQFHDTYLELIGDLDHCRNRALADRTAERVEYGDGLYMASLTSSSLEADRPVLEQHGIRLDPIISARRRLRLPRTGWAETDSRSMYAWNRARTLMSLFLSDHRRPDLIWIPEYQIHPNAVEQLIQVTYVASDPRQDVAYFSSMTGSTPTVVSAERVEFATPRGEVLEILSPARCTQRYERLAPAWIPALGGYGIGITFQVSDLRRCRCALREGGMPFEEVVGAVRVGGAQACGVLLEFRQERETP